MDTEQQITQGSPTDFRLDLLDLLWKIGFGIALAIPFFVILGEAMSWPWVGMPVAWAVGSFLTREFLRRERSTGAAWAFVIGGGIATCLPLVLVLGRDLEGSSVEAIWKSLPFVFLLLTFLAGILLPPWSTLVLLGIEAVAIILPIFSGVGVEPVHVIALLFTGGGAALVWVTSGPLVETASWALNSYRQMEERAEELRLSRDELQKSLQARDTLNDRLRQANVELGRRTAQLQAAAEVSRLVTSVLDLDELLPQVVQLLYDQFDAYVALFLVDESGEEAVLCAFSETSSVQQLQEGDRLEINEQTAVGWCAVRAQPRILSDVRAGATLRDHLLSDTRSEVAFPLMSRRRSPSGGGEVIGVLNMQSPQVGAFGERDEVILTMIAGQIGNAITHIRSFVETRETLQSLTKLQRRYVTESWDRFAPQLDAAGYRWTRGSVSPLEHRPLPEVKRVVSAERTVVEPERGLVAPISLPGGQIIGALGLQDPDPARQWSDDEIALVESVAGQMSIALENARLFKEAQDRVAEITALHKRYLRESYEDFLPTRSQVEFTFAQPGVSREITLSEEIEQVLAENRTLTLVKDDGGEPESALLAPIPLREYVFGALGLQEVGETREWDEDDLALIDAVTEQMAMVIENARLFQETEQRAVELEQIAEELRETDKFRAQFLANMSHELRTPLNSIIGFSRVILKGIDGPLTELQQMDLEAIHSNGQHLLSLINDVLDMSKIEAGKMELVIENVDLTVLVKGVLSISSALVKDKAVELRTEIEPDLPIVRADGTRIRQVCNNLLSNAAKFTHEGSITFRVWRDGEMVFVSVQDTGEGVPEEKMPLLFEAFRQIDASSTRRAEGTGLGLPISKQFVEMHGGRIWAESEVGVGTLFTFCIPIEGPVEEIAELVDLEIDETKKMLLVVERDEDELSIYQGALEGGGYQVVGLYDGRQAVRWARYLSPWAILLDVQLEADLGWEALEALKSTRATRQVPIIVCSTLEEGGQAISMGAVAYQPKPVVVRDLLGTLGRLER